jgi:hypothetical protein
MSSIVNGYINLFQKIRKDSGLSYSIKYYKAVKLHITRYICGKPLMVNSAGVGVDSSGFPKRFLILKGLIKLGKVKEILSLLT